VEENKIKSAGIVGGAMQALIWGQNVQLAIAEELSDLGIDPTSAEGLALAKQALKEAIEAVQERLPEWKAQAITARSRHEPIVRTGDLLPSSNVVKNFPTFVVKQFLKRHAIGDWGDVLPHVWRENNQALIGQGPLVSAYSIGRKRLIFSTNIARTETRVYLTEDTDSIDLIAADLG
jgi:hypothetical protein